MSEVDRGRRRAGRNAGDGFARRDGYMFLSTQPLHVLVFLLPLVVLYEAGSAVYLTRESLGSPRMIRAERLLASFFELFGVGGLYLPGLMLVAVLLIWHVLSRSPWRVRWSVPAWMAAESAGWTVPLLVIGQVVYRMFGGAAPLAAGGEVGGALASLPMGARATIAVGAGLYEELLFRLMAIAAVHAIAADLLKMRDGAAKAAAVFISAAAFALYHDVWLPGGGIDAARLAIFLLAGVYFGTLFVLRGFGIVVAVHALYDLIVLALLRP